MGAKQDRTNKNLKLALTRIVNGRPKVVDKGRKLSISSVAQEAGVSPTTIHRYHPDVVEEINSKSVNSDRQKAEKKNVQLKKERERTSELRNDVGELQAQVQKLTSINARLSAENERLKALFDSKNVAVLNAKTR